MAFEYYHRKGKTMLRLGYTTGTCAALASAAAAEILLGGSPPGEVSLVTGNGIPVTVPVRGAAGEDGSAWAEVRKDAGDDADVTDGILIRSRVRLCGLEIRIDGGEGVGRVTKPGLDQPVGNAAINSGPRRMIREEVTKVAERHGYKGGFDILITVPEGAVTAKKTFNPMLGIEGGISILGTTGIVEPMSEQALIDTIEVELRQISLSSKDLILTPGNYGTGYIEKEGYGRFGIPVLKCSNFLGETLDMAAQMGMERVLLIAHAGKLCKVAAGIMNTHSRYADGRNEVYCAHAAVAGASRDLAEALMQAATTDACMELLDKENLRETVNRSVLEAVDKHLRRRADGAFRIGAVMFSNVYGTLGMTEEAKRIIREWEGKRT